MPCAITSRRPVSNRVTAHQSQTGRSLVAGLVRAIPRSFVRRPSEGGLGGGAFGLCGPCDAGEHRSGIAVQDLLARFLADPRFGERFPRPVAAELGSVGAAYDALGAVQVHG